MSNSDTIRTEIDGYISELNQNKKRITEYRSFLNSDMLLQAETETSIIAIDGILQKLNNANVDNIDLNAIVQITDDVSNVMTTTNRLLAKLQTRNLH